MVHVVQHRIAETDFAGFGNSVHHNGKGAVYCDIAVIAYSVMQFGCPFQFRVIIAVALLLMEYFAVKVSPCYIHALDNLNAASIAFANPEFAVAANIGNNKRIQHVVAVHDQIQAIVRIVGVKVYDMLFRGIGFLGKNRGIAACGVDLWNDYCKGVLLQIEGCVVFERVFPVGRLGAAGFPAGLALNRHGAHVDVHSRIGHAVDDNIIPDIHGRGQFLVDAEFEMDKIGLLLILCRLNPEIGLAFQIDFLHLVEVSVLSPVQHKNAGNFFHKHIVGFGAVLVQEADIDVNAQQLGWGFAGYAVHAVLVLKLEVGPLRHGIDKNIHRPGRKDIVVRVIPGDFHLEILALAVRCHEH